MVNLNIKNETSTLRTLVLGQSNSIGKRPTIEETFDSKSYESVLNGVYPDEKAINKELTAFEQVLLKYNIQVLRPSTLENCNQVFARDVGFVINDIFINSNIIPDRELEKEAYKEIFNQFEPGKIYDLPEKVHVEGGDIVLYNDIVFVGLYTGPDYQKYKTARTNIHAFHFLKEILPEKTFIPLELKKNDTNPREGVLHLDCAFMPVSKNKAIIYKDGFINEKDYFRIKEIFNEQNIFEITKEEMYYMNTNVFSISPKVVVSEQRFTRLNYFMETQWDLTVERVPFYEISKMGGLLRCSTMPLVRNDD